MLVLNFGLVVLGTLLHLTHIHRPKYESLLLQNLLYFHFELFSMCVNICAFTLEVRALFAGVGFFLYHVELGD